MAAADAKIVESLIVDHQLLPGVANVLIDFILWSQDMKLAKALIDKIAAHWSRKKVKTVKEAMQLAVQEQKKASEQPKKQSTFNKSTRQKQQPKRDKLPKWLLAEKEKQKVESQETKAPVQQTQNGEKSFEEMLAERRRNKEQRGEV